MADDMFSEENIRLAEEVCKSLPTLPISDEELADEISRQEELDDILKDEQAAEIAAIQREEDNPYIYDDEN